MTESEGILGAFIWPMYVGLATSDPGEPNGPCEGEPFLHPDYQRGQITWDVLPGDEIIGHAKIMVPPGIYTHLTYHYGPGVRPAGPQLMGKRQLQFPLQAQTKMEVNIDPINQGDWLHTQRAMA